MSSYSYNSSNELTSTSAASFTYDANGNTLTKTNASGTTQYGWDFENRLTQAIVPGVGTVGFRYDPFGRRIQKSGPNGTTNYVYDGANAIEEVDFSGNLVARYAQGAPIDEPLSALRSGTSAFYEQDGLGSVTSLSSVTGTISNSYTYDTFGNATLTGSFVNPYRYTARDYDPETGLQYSRARSYDSATGRFIGEDPLEFAGGVNFYDYVNNRVTGFVDPSGLSGSRPGGPCHPPVGVHTACLPTDNCNVIAGKLWILARMISSHQGWDWNVAPPRGGGRHAGEIAQLWIQYAVCYNLYLQKCKTSCPNQKPSPQPAPQPAPQHYGPPVPIPYIGPVIDTITDPIVDWLGARWEELKNAQPPQNNFGPYGPPPPWWILRYAPI